MDVDQRELSYIAGEKKIVVTLENSLIASYKVKNIPNIHKNPFLGIYCRNIKTYVYTKTRT